MNRISIEFLTRSGCHLCDDAAPLVRLAARWLGMRVDEVDIDSDDDLVREFGLRIPVVRIGGEVVAEGQIDRGDLWRGLLARRFSRTVER